MGIHEGRGQLNKALKELTARWHEAKMSWDDVNAERMEKEYLQPLESDLKSAVGAMDHMAVLLNQIRRECE